MMENIHAWIPAIEKELGAVSHAVDNMRKGDPRLQERLRAVDAQRLPTKLVFTVKPGDSPDPCDSTPWIKRR